MPDRWIIYALRSTLSAVLLLLLAALFLPACAIYGEQPTDTVIAGLHWYRDLPAFQMKRLEWNQVTGPDALVRTTRLCGVDPSRELKAACSIRIIEGGQCIVYSIYSEDEARIARDGSGEPLRKHEVDEHCGAGMSGGGGWNHRETIVLR